MNDIYKLLEIMAQLRDPVLGCPWDLAQDFRTIAPFTLEEAYEVVDAIESDRLDALPGELGDLLFQVVFYAQMGTEAGRFDFSDVVNAICVKMLHRHPHVFGPGAAGSAEEQSRRWEDIKRGERQSRPESTGVLDDIPPAMPALARAAKLGRRAASVGFDWADLAGVRAKIDEELAEVDEAIDQGVKARVAAELGDLLFSVVNLCRHVGVDPEQSLRGANGRFTERFSYIERSVQAHGGEWMQFSPDDLDALWRAAKLDAERN